MITKKGTTILLTIILIISLDIVGSFWYYQRMNSTGVKINDKTNTENKIMQYGIIRQYTERTQRINVHVDVSNWKVYQDYKSGLSIKYPKILKLIRDKNSIKIEYAKSGDWVGTINISKGESVNLKINGLIPDEKFQSIIEWQKEGYVLTGHSFISITRGVFKDAKEGDDKSDLLGLGYLFNGEKPIAHIMLDASYKIEDNIWYGIIKSIKII